MVNKLIFKTFHAIHQMSSDVITKVFLVRRIYSNGCEKIIKNKYKIDWNFIGKQL